MKIKTKFIINGASNTILGYIVFYTLFVFLGDSIGFIPVLLLAHFLSSMWGYYSYRTFVFRAGTFKWVQFAKFQATLLIPLVVNSVLVPIIVQRTEIGYLTAQAIFTTILVIYSYIMHSRVTFSRRKERAD